MATVVLEDIYKRLATKDPIPDERQVFLSKILCNYILLLLLADSIFLFSGDYWLSDGHSCIFGIISAK